MAVRKNFKSKKTKADKIVDTPKVISDNSEDELLIKEADEETDLLGKIITIFLLVLFISWMIVISPAVINYFRDYP